MYRRWRLPGLDHEVHGIQAMFPTWGGRTWFRVSAQVYVEDDDLERLITALR